MILAVICDSCGDAIAKWVVWESRWKHEALCESCYDTTDLEGVYQIKVLFPNLKDGLRELVKDHPGCSTSVLVQWTLDNVAHPILVSPFDSAVKEALRDRDIFDVFKVEGSNALHYTAKEDIE